MSGLIGSYLERFDIPAGTAAELGVVAFSAVEGAMLLAKVNRSAEPIRLVGHTLKCLLAGEIARRGPGAASLQG